MNIQLSEHFTYKKLFRFCLPSIAMMLFTSIYGIVDGFFVSNYVGKTAFAAINLIMPFLIVMACFGFMIGTGGGALVAKTLGEGDKQEANRYFTMLLLLTLILGILMSVVGFAFMRPISYMLGATDDMIEHCVIYGRIINAFNTAYMLQYFFQSFFVTAGKPNLGFGVTIAAGMTNIVLDALFVAVFRWGVAGAAAASVIGQCVGGVLPIFYFIRPNKSLLRLTKTRLELSPLLKACANGSSELMSSISSSIVGMLYNFQLMKYSGENGIAAYGVVMYTQMIFSAVFIGYSVGSAPIVSYNYGAGNHGELKNMLKKGLTVMVVGGIIMTVMAIGLAPFLSDLFVGYDAELFEMTKRAFRIFAFSYMLFGVNIFASSFFTSLNNGGVSAAISFLRTLIFQTSAVMLLPLILKADGIWWAVTFAEALALAVSAAFLIANRKKYSYF